MQPTNIPQPNSQQTQHILALVVPKYQTYPTDKVYHPSKNHPLFIRNPKIQESINRNKLLKHLNSIYAQVTLKQKKRYMSSHTFSNIHLCASISSINTHHPNLNKHIPQHTNIRLNWQNKQTTPTSHQTHTVIILNPYSIE